MTTLYLQPCGVREILRAWEGATACGYQIAWGGKTTDDCVPVGSVEWCERLCGHQRPISFPAWLNEINFHDPVPVTLREGETRPIDFFVKPRDRYKRFDSRVFKAGETLPSGEVWMCRVLDFVEEHRYYVLHGEVVASGCYEGDNWSDDPPTFPLDIPDGWCGSVDIGRLRNGTLALIEAHHPYALDHYFDTDDQTIWPRFLVEGWKYWGFNK